ncbi:MAG: GxxExxY protein [Bacteroidota bacterium]
METLENSKTYALLNLTENDIAKHVFECAMQIHKDLGPGLLENVYLECLAFKLYKKGFMIEKQKVVPIVFEEMRIESGFRIDIHIENKLIVEVKSVDALQDIHAAQMLTYLKLTGNKLGLIINFNTVLLKDGYKRVINGYL